MVCVGSWMYEWLLLSYNLVHYIDMALVYIDYFRAEESFL